jgi:hypothetical protein
MARAKLEKRIDHLVSGTSSVTVAADPEDEDVIVGWAVHDPGVLHYIWVKYNLRKHGFGTILFNFLFPDAPPLHTFLSRNIRKYGLDKKWGLHHYDPYLIEDLMFSAALRFDTEAVNEKIRQDH